MTTHDAPLTDEELAAIAALVAVYFGKRPRPGLTLSCGCAWDYDCPAHSADRLAGDVPSLLAEVRRLRAALDEVAGWPVEVRDWQRDLNALSVFVRDVKSGRWPVEPTPR